MLSKMMTARYSKPFLMLISLGAFVSVFASQPLRRARTLTTTSAEKVEVWKVGNAERSWYEDAYGRCWNFEGRTQRLSACPSAKYQGLQRAYGASGADGMGSLGTSGMGVVSSIGSCRIPVIMVAYPDLDFLPGTDAEKLTRFLNEEGYDDEELANGSVADYFRSCSYGKFQPKFDVVAKVTVSNGYKYYGEHAGTQNDAHVADLVAEAVELAVGQGVDFSAYATDGTAPIVSIVHAGPGEHEDLGDDCDDYVWAHFRPMAVAAGNVEFRSYIINNESIRYFSGGKLQREVMTGIGTFCHEFGHALGLPDTYDVNGGAEGSGETPGYWDIMDYQFMFDGYRPTSYNAYERAMLGWLQIPSLTQKADCVLAPLDGEASSNDVQAVRIVNPDNEAEYFILENRRKNKFYAGAYLGEGMVVWHVDYDAQSWNSNRVNANAALQRVQVVPADGKWQSVKDLNLTDSDGNRYTYTGDVFPGYEAVTTFDGNVGAFHAGNFDAAVVNISVLDDGSVTFNYTPTVGIGNIGVNDSDAAPFYGIDGRRLPDIPAHGLYIQGRSIWWKR